MEIGSFFVKENKVVPKADLALLFSETYIFLRR